MTFHEAVEAEIAEAASFLDGRQLGLGADFVVLVDAAITSILQGPDRLPIEIGSIRRQRVTRFPYDILFRVLDGGEVRILAVRHHARSDYWKTRE